MDKQCIFYIGYKVQPVVISNYNELMDMFTKVEAMYKKYNIKISISYITYKLLQLTGYTKLLPYTAVVPGMNLYRKECRFKAMCPELGWDFISIIN